MSSTLTRTQAHVITMVEAIRLNGTAAQKQRLFQLVLEGKRFGNAFCEVGTKTPTTFKTRVTRQGDSYRLNGTKFGSAKQVMIDCSNE